MSKGYGVRTRELREIFSASPDESLAMQTIYERMKAAGVGDADERKGIRDALPWMLRSGYLVRTGKGKDASFKYSGQGMRRLFAAESHHADREKQIRTQKGRTQEKFEQRRASRIGCRAGRIPKPAMGIRVAAGGTETVEEFRARGGQIERLTTHWEQTEHAA